MASESKYFGTNLAKRDDVAGAISDGLRQIEQPAAIAPMMGSKANTGKTSQRNVKIFVFGRSLYELS